MFGVSRGVQFNSTWFFREETVIQVNSRFSNCAVLGPLGAGRV